MSQHSDSPTGPQMIKHKVPMWSRTPLLDIRKEWDETTQKKWTNMYPQKLLQMFIAVLFIIAQRAKQPRDSSVDEWIN